MGRTRLWFCVKKDKGDSDSNALIDLEETDGLVRLNREPATAAEGTLTVIDAVAGDIHPEISAEAMKRLAPDTYYYDLQVRYATGVVKTLAEGTFIVRADVKRDTV